MAGLAAAWALVSAAPEVPVRLLEGEPLTFSHSSARNAAIFRPLEQSTLTTALAARSYRWLRELSVGEPLLDEVGLLLTADDAGALDGLLGVARALGVEHQELTRAALEQRAPLLRGGNSAHAIELPTGGVLDIHRLGERLRQLVVQRGAQIHTRTPVAEILTAQHRVRGVRLRSGESITANRVVIAAGAWSAELGASCGAELPLQPHRRHLAHLVAEARLPAPHPVTWHVQSGAYLRVFGEQVLACPGDHTPHAPGVPNVDPAQLERLAIELPALAPALRNARLQRAWACLRTLTPDGQAVIGADPRVEGLYWLAGLGGFGMTAGLATGQLLADAMLGTWDPTFDPLRPDRLLRP